MKKIIILAFLLAATTVSAQNPESYRAWFDVQLAEHVGLNSWYDQPELSDYLPRTSITEFRAAINIPVIRLAKSSFIGLFSDMGVGFMPGPRKTGVDIATLPSPNPGSQFYLRSENDRSGETSANFIMTFGVFARIQQGAWSIRPYLGTGFMTINAPTYEGVLKQQGSNMEYNAYVYWLEDTSDYDSSGSMSYFTGRLNFAYPLGGGNNKLLIGLEYTYFLTRPEFGARYANAFNENVYRNYTTSGNHLNMLGISLGLSFN